MRNFSLFLLLLLSPLVHAEFSTGIGLFAHNLYGTTTSSDGKKSLIGPIYFPIQARYSTQALWQGLQLSPYFELTHFTTLLVKNETPDGTAKRNFAILGSPVMYTVGPRWFITAGPAFMYYELKGKGGTKVVNNGTGTTAFGVPGKTQSSKILLFEVGTGWMINDFRIGLDLYLSGLASERFAMSFQATLSKTIGGNSW